MSVICSTKSGVKIITVKLDRTIAEIENKNVIKIENKTFDAHGVVNENKKEYAKNHENTSLNYTYRTQTLCRL